MRDTFKYRTRVEGDKQWKDKSLSSFYDTTRTYKFSAQPLREDTKKKGFSFTLR